MIKHCILILLFFIISLCLKAQTNLLVDGSFEDATVHTNGSFYFFSLNKWNNPNNLSPDYFNDLDSYILSRPSYSGFNYQQPKEGNGLVALFAIQQGFPNIARDYVQGTFTQPLQASKTYEVKFYVSLVNNTRVAVKHIGAYLSTEPITFTYRCELEPQIESNTILSDTLNWMEIKGEYIAQGGEKHITLGNFRDDKQSDTLVLPVGINVLATLNSYYYIDDVSVVCLDCPQVNVGINEQAKNKNSVLYNIEKNTLTPTSSGTLVLYNLLGNKVLEQKTQAEQSVILPELAKGLYVWQFQSNTANTQGKFIVE